MKSKQINRNSTTLVRIDKGIHQLLKIKATEAGTSIKTLLEGYSADLLAVEEKNDK